MAVSVCRRCGKEKPIYKEGFCYDCFMNKIDKIYLLKPRIKYRANMPKQLIEEIANNKYFDKKEIVMKYGISMQRLYQILNTYFDIAYIDREPAECNLPNQIK